jgi:hypothetical protein
LFFFIVILNGFVGVGVVVVICGVGDGVVVVLVMVGGGYSHTHNDPSHSFSVHNKCKVGTRLYIYLFGDSWFMNSLSDLVTT